jgi:hypothetical protein
MLCAQAVSLITAVFAVTVRQPTVEKPGPVWSSLGISLFVVGMTSNKIAWDHDGVPGADILAFGGPVLIGMGLMAALMFIRLGRAEAATRRSR